MESKTVQCDLCNKIVKSTRGLIVQWANDKKWLLTGNLEDSLEYVLISTLGCANQNQASMSQGVI